MIRADAYPDGWSACTCVCEKVVAYYLKPADQWTPRLKPHREQRAGEELGVLSQ